MAVDEQSLKMNGRVATKRTVRERLMGPLFVGASVVAGIVVLYLVGLWVDELQVFCSNSGSLAILAASRRV